MTPEQALREAIDHTRFLADHLEGRMGDGALADMRMKADEWEEAHATVRRHLAASAVAYVPEQIRRLPEKWRKVAANTRVMSLLEPADEAAADIYDQCAQELERALDSAHAVSDRDSLQFGVTRDCRVFVGYVNRDEEGGFTVLAWAPDWVTTKGGE